METACFLAGLGSNVSVVVRSKILRTFDQQVVRQLEEKLEQEDNMNIYLQSRVKKIDKLENGKMNVYVVIDNQEQMISDVECVVLAVGRTLNSQNLGLDQVSGVKLNSNR